MNKRGSISVFLTAILASVMALTIAFVTVSQSYSVISQEDAISRLAGQSVIGKYDEKMFTEYYFMVHFGKETKIETELALYLNSNLKSAFENVKVDRKEHKLLDVNNAKLEILDASLHEGRETELEEGGISLNMVDLPSNGNKASPSVMGLVDGYQSLRDGGESYLINKYIFNHFKRDDVKYILFGKGTREDNDKAFKSSFITLRTTLNEAHILTDGVKRREINALAQTIAPGAAGVALAATLSFAWALAEANNDWKLLNDDENVDFKKSNDTWALSIENVFNMESGEEKKLSYIKPKSDEGLSYDEYLKLYLNCLSESPKILRILDLIQMDMIDSYYSEFRIDNYSTGFDFVVNTKNGSYELSESYVEKEE